jgi:hypothetical protein
VSRHLIELPDEWALWPVAAIRGAGLPFDWLGWLAEPGGPGADGRPGRSGLPRLLSEPLFTAALTWQNPAVVAAWLGPLIASGGTAPEAGKIRSRRAGLLARYAQRYCAKNETIGFFGPVGWARLTAGHMAEPVVSGAGGIRQGKVFFEHWAIELLARAFEADERVWPHLPVRRHAAVSIEERTARRPFRPPIGLDPQALAVLDQVVAGRTAGEIEPRAVLLWLRDAGIVRIGFTVEVGEQPEGGLRAQVARIADPGLRDEMLGVLAALDQARCAAAKVMTEPVHLGRALGELDDLFVRHTGRAARRGKTETGVGRTLVYPDCRRDLDVVLGAPLIGRLAAPLTLLLHSVRWLTAQVADAVEVELTRTYAGLRARRSEVTLAEMHFAATEMLAGGPASPVHDVARDFRLRWAAVVDAAPDVEEVRVAVAAVAARVAALFPDPGRAPAWAAARQHSPDLMLARTGGALRWVLGELHVAMNTLENRCFHALCDDPAELAAATAADMSAGRVVPCYPTGPIVDSRRYPPLAVQLPDQYLYWSYGDDTGPPAGGTSLPATGLTITEDRDGLCAGPRAGSWRLPVREFFGEFLSALVVNCFQLSTGDPYEPRLVIDDLIVRRRAWRFTVDELPAGHVSRRGYHWQVLADWLAAAGLPRHVFARNPAEPKPFYVDLRSPLLVTNLARSWLRLPAGARIELREMLPAPDQLWFADPDGRRYTTEIRMVAVDRRPGARPLRPKEVLS